MTRIKLVLAVAAVMVAMLAALPGPAMAADRDGWDEDWNFWTWAPGWWDWNDHRDNWNDGLAFDQSADSGDVDIDTSVSSSGDYSSQSVAPLQFGNSGNLQNAQGVTQINSDADDIELSGSSFEFSPSQEFDSNQTVRQSATSR